MIYLAEEPDGTLLAVLRVMVLLVLLVWPVRLVGCCQLLLCCRREFGQVVMCSGHHHARGPRRLYVLRDPCLSPHSDYCAQRSAATSRRVRSATALPPLSLACKKRERRAVPHLGGELFLPARKGRGGLCLIWEGSFSCLQEQGEAGCASSGRGAFLASA